MSKDEWRITSRAIELEMERIAGLLQRSIHSQSRTGVPHPPRQRHETEPAPALTPEFVHQR